MKTQVVFIHGGETFDTYENYLAFLNSMTIKSLDYFKGKGWKDSLQEKLGNDFDVIMPRMPNSLNAKYVEWKIWFEKVVPLVGDGLILVGYSLGGIFLAKYLAENTLGKKIRGVFLVAAPFDDTIAAYSLADFVLPNSLKKLEAQCSNIHLYHSSDDPVAPLIDLEKYKKALPTAAVTVFADRGHFWQETFPEIVTDIQKAAV